jgi:glycosyltransferase involved in cell wall biosynthesis
MERAGKIAPRDTVLFVSCWSTMGGAQVSLASVMREIHPIVRTSLLAPAAGPFVDRVHRDASVDEHLTMPSFTDTPRPKVRTMAAFTLLRWLLHNRGRLLAVHANGDAELKLLLPVLFAVRCPVVVWYHRGEMSPTTQRLRPLWRKLGRRIRWAAVSTTAREQLEGAGVDPSRVALVPNPIDPRDVVPDRLATNEPPIFGYLGCEHEAKGVLLLPDIADHLATTGTARMLVVTKDYPPERNSDEVNQALARLRANDSVEFARRDFDVRNIYARIDALLVPSLNESFCRIAVEAMLVGRPVVASDLPAVRAVTGDGEAAVLFPVGDASAAARAVEQVAADPELQQRLVDAGHGLVDDYAPDAIAGALLQLYSEVGTQR